LDDLFWEDPSWEKTLLMNELNESVTKLLTKLNNLTDAIGDCNCLTNDNF
jgi:hypothetical protein